MNGAHYFFQYVDDPGGLALVRLISVALLNGYTGQNHSRNNWKRKGTFSIPWTRATHDKDGKPTGHSQHQSNQLSIDLLDNHIKSSRTFGFDSLGIYDPRCAWLDFSLDVALNFHFTEPDLKTAVAIKAQSPLGDAYPYHPVLDREGRLNTDFQGVLLKRIKTLRRELVAESDSPGTDGWVEKLRSLVSECVSLIDGTLHQIYYKAKFNPEPGWKFDEKDLGPRHGVRLANKLGWIFKITGHHLNAGDDHAAFVELKDLRNHLQHFDPPSFCYTLEDAERWLNLVPAVASFNWAIRKCVGATLSVPLIELLLERPVKFLPRDPGKPRKPQDETVGYASVRVKPEPA